ncbi:MAG TPA: TylF/MycF/NovP-related O-methyltransferase [Candidatus Acidoferrales bacterium]|nr:TylF/MycF/NovP-related O-methyltransferase [Candidatus Acidoferrales bacterium]
MARNAGSKATLRKRIAASVFRRYSPALDSLNANARVSEWIARNAPQVRVVADKWALYDYLNDDVLGPGAIDYLEFGVYRGASMRGWLQRNRHPESRFVGFDSFEGLPERWGRDFATGAFDTGGRLPDIDDPRVSFVKGWFQQSLRGFLRDFQPRNRLVVHNDSDLYSSTLYVLATLDPWIVPGTVLIFDEFSTPLHEFRAFADYTSAFVREATPVAMSADYAMQAAFVFG